MDLEFKLKFCICVSSNEFSSNCILRCRINTNSERILDIIDTDIMFQFKRIVRSDLIITSIDIESSLGIISLFFMNKEELTNFRKWLGIDNQFNLDKINALIKESFEIQLYQNEKIGFDSKIYLKDQIKILMDRFNPIDCYGPFTTVCQASGFGKSKACFSLVDEGFYVVYCCLRPELSSGYPNRSCLADFLLSNSTEDMT
ncbi:hypothetical protein BpHYR1_044278 [Brachionus plicatilis]|uniref:Uncharacterized protein n=1 Tax=Brachionus plicatilis TaxID=10195 RepID=A0A3M7PD60_BRAPC|nr:hypothetical protein BpHYR1_044278 [Brachionus plicatilis]